VALKGKDRPRIYFSLLSPVHYLSFPLLSLFPKPVFSHDFIFWGFPSFLRRPPKVKEVEKIKILAWTKEKDSRRLIPYQMKEQEIYLRD